MNQPIAKSAQSVQNALDKKGLKAPVIELPASTRTAQEAAHAIGCSIAQIVKSLIFKTVDSHTPILVLASGPNRVNEQVISQLAGQSITKADADFTRTVTGFAIGGIPPIGHPQQIRTFIDQDLLKHTHVWAAAGTPNAVFSIEASLLPEVTGGIVVNIL